VTSGGPYGIFVASTDGSSQRQLTNLGYESIAGWSLDGTQLYYAIPDSSNNGFLLKAVDVASGDVHDLFVLENSSRKAPLPTISPDGNWIAYRGSDNGSLYIMRMDGTQGRLVVEKPSVDYAISGIVWEPSGSLIGVSMLTPENPDGEIILVQWDGCEAYQITTLHGELDGLLIP
jgi:Tol biopolymer transport system component